MRRPVLASPRGFTRTLGRMADLDAKELKRALIAQGFEVYRVLGDRVQLADRVRDNLIMDSGVAAGVSLSAWFVARAARRHHPHDTEAELLGRARTAAGFAVERGYTEASTAIVPVRDPGDAEKVLDTWFEITYVRKVGSLEGLFEELRFLLAELKQAGTDDV
jgi:hypothetical protein